MLKLLVIIIIANEKRKRYDCALIDNLAAHTFKANCQIFLSSKLENKYKFEKPNSITRVKISKIKDSRESLDLDDIEIWRTNYCWQSDLSWSKFWVRRPS